MASESTLRGRVTGQRSSSKGPATPGFTWIYKSRSTVSYQLFFHPGMVWGGPILGVGGGILGSILTHNSFY